MRRMDIDELLNGIIQDATRALRKAQFEEAITRMHARIHAIERRIQEHWWEAHCSEIERASLLVTSNLAFSDWGQVFQGERMTAALLDRLTHRCHIFEMNGESYRFRESVKTRKGKGH
jgi:hypothetical protein